MTARQRNVTDSPQLSGKFAARPAGRSMSAPTVSRKEGRSSTRGSTIRKNRMILQTVDEVIFPKCIKKNVGAVIDRPAAQCNGFAAASGKFAARPVGRSMSAPTVSRKEGRSSTRGSAIRRNRMALFAFSAGLAAYFSSVRKTSTKSKVSLPESLWPQAVQTPLLWL